MSAPPWASDPDAEIQRRARSGRVRERLVSGGIGCLLALFWLSVMGGIAGDNAHTVASALAARMAAKVRAAVLAERGACARIGEERISSPDVRASEEGVLLWYAGEIRRRGAP